MKLKHAIQFVVFLALSLFATYRLGLLHDTARGNRQRAALMELYRDADELERLKRHESDLYTDLGQLRNTLAGASTAYLPDPADPYAWTSRQVRYLAQQAGIQMEISDAGEGPRIRTRRDAPDRQFSVCRCQADFSGSLEQILAFIQLAEIRNPYLIVSDLLIGPQKDEQGLRYGNITLDWPSWSTPDLREELLAEIAPMVESPASIGE